MSALILVRHSSPRVEADFPSTEWKLSAEGRLAARALAQALIHFSPPAIFTSPEIKARETAEEFSATHGATIVEDKDLREHERVGGGSLPRADFLHGVERLLRSSGELVFGLETADEVFSRLQRAVGRARSPDPGRHVLVVSHGTAISIYAARCLGLDAMKLWEALRTPTAIIIEDGKMEMVIPDGAA